MKLKLNELGRIAHPKSEYAIRKETEGLFYFMDEDWSNLHTGLLTKEQAYLWKKTFCEKLETYEDVVNDLFTAIANTIQFRDKLFKYKQRIKKALLNE